MEIIVVIICLLAAAGFAYVSFMLEKRRKKYINGVKKFSEDSKRFEGVVTSTAKDYVMLKFRDEEQKKTIHHKYTFARKRYKADSAVTVFYDEQSDSACVEGDNPFVHKAVKCAAGSAVCAAAALAAVVAAVVNIV